MEGLAEAGAESTGEYRDMTEVSRGFLQNRGCREALIWWCMKSWAQQIGSLQWPKPKGELYRDFAV